MAHNFQPHAISFLIVWVLRSCGTQRMKRRRYDKKKEREPIADGHQINRRIRCSTYTRARAHALRVSWGKNLFSNGSFFSIFSSAQLKCEHPCVEHTYESASVTSTQVCIPVHGTGCDEIDSPPNILQKPRGFCHICLPL